MLADAKDPFVCHLQDAKKNTLALKPDPQDDFICNRERWVVQAGKERKRAVAASDRERGILLCLLPLNHVGHIGHVGHVLLQGLVIILIIFIADLIIQIVIILSPPPTTEATANAKNYDGVISKRPLV
jgi:hypothetical protein